MMPDTIPSSLTGHTLHLATWESSFPLGVVQVLHGMREHMGRYADFAGYMTQHGFHVVGHDQLGHGKTAVESGAFGYFGERDGAKSLLRDCGAVTMEIQRRYPGLPIFLLGHSMGSFIGRIYITGAAGALSGFLCLGTGGPSPSMSFGRAVSTLCAAVGSKRPSRLVSRMMGAYTAKGIASSEHRASWLTRDLAVLQQYAGDPMSTPKFTNRAFCDLFDLQLAANRPDWAERVDPSLPILLASGGNDPVGDRGKGVVDVYERLKLAGVRDVRCRLYDGARHEILNEINREEVYYDLLCWMEERL